MKEDETIYLAKRLSTPGEVGRYNTLQSLEQRGVILQQLNNGQVFRLKADEATAGDLSNEDNSE